MGYLSLKALVKRLFQQTSGHLVATIFVVALLLGLPSPLAFGQIQDFPVIKIISAGGTIANTRQGRVSIERVIVDIKNSFPETHKALDNVKFDITDLMQIGSQDFSSYEFLTIARAANKAITDPRIKGVIVTQGTFSTEETAYFLHLLVKSNKPIVVVNSQRLHKTLGNDGDKNFIDAVSVVLSPDAAGKGALVVTNQTINSGREVLKTSVRPGGFISGVLGVLGIIERDRVTFYRAPTRRHTLRSEFDIKDITTLPKVVVISSYFDADPQLIRAAADLGIQGIVINGFTNGGIPYKDQRPILEELANKGIVIVLTARGGINNRVAVTPHNLFVEGDNLVAHKARILLQLALTKTDDRDEIQRIFNEY